MPYLEREGVRLHYRESGRGRPPLLFVPGFGGSTGHWAAQSRVFARAHRIVRVDLRGHGRSDAPESGYGIEAFAEELGWMMRRLRVRRPVIIGHSMGGTVALHLALQQPRDVRAIVMVDSLISPETRDALRDRVPQRWREMFHPASDRKMAIAVEREVARIEPHVRAPSTASVFRYDAVAALAKLSVPGMFVAADGGGRDPEQSRRVLTGTDVWFAQAVGTGHYVMMEVPDQFNAMLRRFLRAV